MKLFIQQRLSLFLSSNKTTKIKTILKHFFLIIGRDTRIFLKGGESELLKFLVNP